MSYPDISNLTLTTKKGFPDVDKLTEDVSNVLNDPQLHSRIKQQVLDGALWWMADYSGKGLKCQFRSKKADGICKPLLPGSKVTGLGLVHEHIIPKNLIRGQLSKLTIPVDKEEVKRLLKLSAYCLVHKDDDAQLNKEKLRKKMPRVQWQISDAIPEDIWARYKTSGVEII
ncbi:MAG: hypothetical protein NTV11_09790 [Rhodocyclales bacterium]|nr:hypothetical protein [Rhodocyclales bacterium]